MPDLLGCPLIYHAADRRSMVPLPELCMITD
jgi:hypothetical protein